MAEPIAIAHLTTERGERVCGAADDPLALDISIEVLTDGQWQDRRSVARCGRCVQIVGNTPISGS
jgi:hypothetical protein